MNIVLTILAAVAAVAAVVLFWLRMRAGSEIGLMAATRTSTAAEARAMPAGTLVELKGRLRCTAPVAARYAEGPAVYVRTLVEREYRQIRRDSNGRTQSERRFATVTDTTAAAAECALEDASGSVPLSFDGAKVEARQVHQHYEPVAASVGSVIGGLIGVGDNTLGHRFTEWAIAPDADIYVLGSALGGGVGAGRPNPFIISVKSEEERSKGLSTRRLWLLVGAAACAVLALGLLYFAFRSG